MDSTRVAHHNTVVRYIKVYIRVWGNQNIASDGNVANDGRIGFYHDSVAEYRHALASTAHIAADDDPAGDGKIVADFCAWIDDDAPPMRDDDPIPALDLGWDPYPRSAGHCIQPYLIKLAEDIVQICLRLAHQDKVPPLHGLKVAPSQRFSP